MTRSRATHSTPRPTVRAFIRSYATNSQAALVETDEGEFVIKAMNNRDGTAVLIAEWIGTNAARWLGLSVPDCAIVELTDIVDVPLDEEAKTLAAPGPCFGSRLIHADGWNGDPGTLASVENAEAIAGVVVADSWLRNVDRYCPNSSGPPRFNNPRNLLLSGQGAAKGKFRLYAIDFGHAFGGPAWSTRTLRQIDSVQDGTIYGAFPKFRPYLTRERVAPFLARLAAASGTVVDHWLAALPREWGAAADVRRTIREFLTARASWIRDKLDKMVWEDDSLWTSGLS